MGGGPAPQLSFSNGAHASTGAHLRTLLGQQMIQEAADAMTGLIERLEFSPTGTWLLGAGGANDGFVVFFEVADGKIIHQDKAPMHIYDFEMLESGDASIEAPAAIVSTAYSLQI